VKTHVTEMQRIVCGSTVAFIAMRGTGEHRLFFGGTRIRSYPSEEAARKDAEDLACAMSRKMAISGLRGGGAKAVLIEPPTDRAGAVKTFGAYVESLGGRFRTGADYGYTPDDDAVLKSATQYVSCGGDAAYTSRTVYLSMKALIEPRTVAIQGLGAAGRPLAEMLKKDGVRVIASDVRDFEGFERAPADSIYDVEADVFAPCATGGILDAETVKRLRVRVVCGAANNPFAGDEDAERLHARGIRYVPDFVANSGALIHGASIILGEQDRIEERIQAVPGLVKKILDRSRAHGLSPHTVAVTIADDLMLGRKSWLD